MSRRLYSALGALVGAALSLGSTSCFARVVRPAPEAAASAGDRFDFALWDQLLRAYVDDAGRVDYQALKASPADASTLEKLYAQVGRQSLDALGSRQAKEAFLVDAYNVCVWKNVVDRLPKLTSVDDAKTSFFYFTKFVVAGRETSLYALENDVIRPTFADPRVHMALNCASGGCPVLPREAFTPANLDAQLGREARRFVADPSHVRWDPATRTVTLSKIFDWYKKDFDGGQVLAWINAHRPASQQLPPDAKIVYASYDWSLNDRSLRR